MPVFHYDGLKFNYRTGGEGVPFVFQHGLGGDVGQPFGLFQPPPGFRMIAFDCRAHGKTRPVGVPAKIDISAFVQDCAALMDHLKIPSAIIGGISMGAALALEFTLRHPKRVMGLVLSRPAWLDRPHAAKGNPYLKIARLIRRYGAKMGAELLLQSGIYRECLRKSPDAAASLLRQFTHPRADETVIRLERIPKYAPPFSRKDWRKIRAPVLVLGNRQDPIHPIEFARILARNIPGAKFRELTPKSVSPEAHTHDTQRYIAEFLLRNWSARAQHHGMEGEFFVK